MFSRFGSIAPCIWMDGAAEEAARSYIRLFDDSRILSMSHYGKAGEDIHGQPEGRVLVVAEFELMGTRFSALNGGPAFGPSPAISFFVLLPDRDKVDALWSALSEGGRVLMELNAYDWSPRYGWLDDRYGVSWQISWDQYGQASRPITPLLAFTKGVFGRAREALDFYASVFPDSAVELAATFPPETGIAASALMHGRARLGGGDLMAMDAPGEHAFGFDEGVSLAISCADQDEIDHYWDRLVEGGGSHSACGWLTDRFGVSWQVVPAIIPSLLTDPDRAKVDRVMAAVLQMTRPIIEDIETAAREAA